MKVHNRIMSWILSPGAYAVWHALGNPEEWTWEAKPESLIHRSGLSLSVFERFKRDVPFFVYCPLLFLLGSFFLDCEREYKGAIGYLDRHLIAGRAYRLRTRLDKGQKVSEYKARNMAVFTKLTVNQ